VHDRKVEPRFIQPLLVQAQIAEVGLQGGEHAVGIGGKGADHHCGGRRVVVLLVVAADADADGTDPIFDVGAAAQSIRDRRQAVGEGIGYVEKAEVGAGRDRSELGQAEADHLLPIAPFGTRCEESVHGVSGMGGGCLPTRG